MRVRFLMSEGATLTVWISPPADRYSSQCKNNYLTEMCSGSGAGSYLRLMDFCITQL